MIISSPFIRPYTVIRKGSIEYVEGIAQEPRQTTFGILGSVQPLSGKDLLSLTEGDRVKDTLRLYVETQLKVGQPGLVIPSDLVVIEGKNYEVRTVNDWTRSDILPHYKAILIYDNRNDDPDLGVM